MDKHTQGPLEAVGNLVRSPMVSGGFLVAECRDANGQPYSDEAKANAALFAAAPELNDLVKEARAAMTAYLEDHQHNAPHDCYATGPKTGDEFHDLVRCPGCCAEKAFTSLVAKVDAALAKARGEHA